MIFIASLLCFSLLTFSQQGIFALDDVDSSYAQDLLQRMDIVQPFIGKKRNPDKVINTDIYAELKELSTDYQNEKDSLLKCIEDKQVRDRLKPKLDKVFAHMKVIQEGYKIFLDSYAYYNQRDVNADTERLMNIVPRVRAENTYMFSETFHKTRNESSVAYDIAYDAYGSGKPAKDCRKDVLIRLRWVIMQNRIKEVVLSCYAASLQKDSGQSLFGEIKKLLPNSVYGYLWGKKPEPLENQFETFKKSEIDKYVIFVNNMVNALLGAVSDVLQTQKAKFSKTTSK